MALIVEDGTAVAGADTFATAIELEEHSTKYWDDNLPGPTSRKEASLIRAMLFLRGLDWHGTGVTLLPFPRIGAKDCIGAVPENTVPPLVKEAQLILAYHEHLNPGTLSPAINRSQMVRRQKVKDIEREFFDKADGSADDFRAVVTSAIDLIKCYLKDGGAKYLGGPDSSQIAVFTV